MRRAGPKRPVSLWRLHTLLRNALIGTVLGATAATSLGHAAALLVRHICDPPRRRPSQAASARTAALATAACEP